MKAKRSPHKSFLYKEGQLNEDFEAGFKGRDWENPVRVIKDLDLMADFRKDRVQVEVQFGNAARLYADVMKFQLAFLQDQIDLGVEILPTNEFAKKMNSNLANYERAVREIDRFTMAITMPIWIVGIEPEGGHPHGDAEKAKDWTAKPHKEPTLDAS